MVLCCNTATCCYGAIMLFLIFFALNLVKKFFQQRKLNRWNNTPKDVVILHGFPAGKTIPNPSPFVLKVITYLRMANINYKIDTKDQFGPKGKSPWISLNGEHVADSQFIVEHLSKKFENNLNGSYSEEQLALATAIRIMLEEHVFWGLGLDRFIFTPRLGQILKASAISRWLFQIYVGFIVKRNAKAQGVGRHSEQEILHIMTKNLRAVSKLLGNKKFILGDVPCEDDAAIFGFLSQLIWCQPDSPYEKLVNDELTNIKGYCLRMREKYYADWDHILAK